MRHFEAVITREGKWWMVSIPEIEGLTQARRLSEARRMAQEYIAVTLGLPLQDVDVSASLGSVGAVTDIPAVLESVEADREKAAELERLASRQMIELAKALAAEAVPVRDIGTVLGVSHQRAHQLVSG